ncbi:MAG: hypothetical protein LBE91_10770 [Tannerella sp.]|jgi:hypothetical protein|nr:hypothetical protein [Tannerella sp.]
MKKKLFFIIQICIVLVAANGFYGCNDTVTGTEDTMRGVSVLPNPMTAGQKVSISGPGFKDATKITFPGGVAVTDFTKAGEFQLNTLVPEGVASEGKISVTLPDGEFVIPLDVTIFSTRDLVAIAMDVNPVTKNYVVGPNDKLTIQGKGLGPIIEIMLPGGLSINSMNFAKKTDSYIEINIPMSGFDRNAVEPLQMKGQSGEIFYTANTLEWNGEGYIPPELLPFCGRSYKVWGWDVDKLPTGAFGNGGYNSNTGPTWWIPTVNSQYGGPGHGEGATMAFYLPNKMVLTLTNGTVYTGKFTVDVSKPVGTWSIGQLKITGGDEALSIVGGTKGPYNGTVDIIPKVFEIVTAGLTDTKMTLAFRYPAEPGTANFYLFSLLESGDDPE